MPSNLYLPDDDLEPDFKFDDCAICIFRNRPRTCAQCDTGEFFEEEEPEGLDSILSF